MTLSPPDLSRGHVPIMGLFLANPGRALAPIDLLNALPRISNTSMHKSLGILTRNRSLILHDGRYRPATPFPESRRERHTRNERAKRDTRRAQGLPAKKPSSKDYGYTSAAARKQRQDATIRNRLQKRAQVREAILTGMRTKPRKTWKDTELFAFATGAMSVKREALSDLMLDGSVQYSSAPAQHGYKFWLPTTPSRKRRPTAYTTQHAAAHAIASKGRVTRGVLVERTAHALDITPDAALQLVTDLYHGGHVTYHPVGAAVVVRPGPTPTSEEAHAAAA
ncbi:hypothetical protein [Deinococcus sp. 23YEL01]|uniref:hypothetical protein n=1 Tax=Deinococcus sp. 23YEL01 TaxID=2745871 RepID=UPI001E48F707|nr:hypothetical protein [Deinococcus sp. 23YEL01]MCD0168038.1 hypothetical protein [Deinococcus sp. 23YEL01]